MVLYIFQRRGDYRPMCRYMQEEYGVKEETIDSMLRGFYDNDGKIVFFSGYEHEDANESDITQEIVEEIVKVMESDIKTVEVWNDVNKVKVGELWEPKMLLYTIRK